jgi:LETM1 and EF-hand domain-containing protein 1
MPVVNLGGCLPLQVRAGEPVSQYEIVKFAQLFNDELTLDNLERIHLVNLCRFVGIQPFGTDAFLVSGCLKWGVCLNV